MKSKGILNLYQLHGGIHRYQEAFPSGGYFKGKNFVYDPRCAISAEETNEVIGRCRLCSELFDDYKCKRRCRHCRVLQLICESCSSKIQSSSNNNSNNHSSDILCQLCDPHSNGFQR